MFEITKTTQFKKDFKLICKRNYELSKLEIVLKLLISGKPLPEKYKEHPLKNVRGNLIDCHITSDWILLFKRDIHEKLITLIRTGTHSDIF
jgi:mRNA interferase YafQ